MSTRKPSPVIRRRDQSENLYQLVETLEVLEIGLTAYQQKKSAWMIISARLHALLTDSSGGNEPLAKRVIPNLQLHPLRQDLSQTTANWLMAAPGFRFGPEGYELDLFDLEKPRIPLAEWLKQVAYIQFRDDQGHSVTLEQLIIEPRHQAGGVHFDMNVRQEMILIEGMFSFVYGETERLSFRDCVFAVGQYIHTELTTQLMGGLANGYASEGRTEQARAFYEEALALGRKAGNLQGISYLLGDLGLFLANLHEYDQSVASYMEALEISRRIGDTDNEQSVMRNLIVVNHNFGNMLYENGNYDEAIHAYRKALHYAHEIDDELGMLFALVNLGLVYLKRGQVQTAIALWTACMVRFHFDDSNRSALATIVRNLSDIRRNTPGFRARFEEALAELAKRYSDATGLESDIETSDSEGLYWKMVELLDEYDDFRSQHSIQPDA